MGDRTQTRPLDAARADIEEAGEAAREIVERGRVAWDGDFLLDHIYHRIDYAALWTTLEEDVPQLVEQLRRWRQVN